MSKQTYDYSVSQANPKIVFVSGGPGCGKGTQCERLVRDYHFEHISVGDVVRDEIARGTPEGEKFRELAAKGELVPDQLAVGLIIKTIKARNANKYLIDGFPRGVEQAKLFERKFKEIDYILSFDVPDDMLTDRLIGRGLTSGRADDNVEAIANRLRVFHDKTQPVLDFYRHVGKVKTIDGRGSIDDVYKQTQEEIKPNIIFLAGPPCVGKTSCALKLADKIKAQVVNIESFNQQFSVKNETDRVNKLVSYLNLAPYNNFIIDDFFSSKADAEIFLTHFAKPQKLFYIDATKDEVHGNIVKYIPNEKDRRDARAGYDTFVKTRASILSLVEKEPYFQRITGNSSISAITDQLLQSIRPLVVSAFMYNNMDLGLEYCDALEKERGFVFLEVAEQCQNEIERGTTLGAKMSAFSASGQEIPAKFQVELLQKILFADPHQTRFVLTHFPERSAHFELFEKDVFPIDFLINFNHPQQQIKFYHDESPLLSFFSRGKYIHIDRLALDIVDAYINDRAIYGFVLGAVASGKTTISKYIATKFAFTLVEWEPTFEMLKAKLGGEDGPIDELSYDQVEKYFVETLNPKKNTNKTLFDGWPSTYTFAQFQQFTKKIGLPSLIIDLQLRKEVYVRRYKIKNEQDPEGETSEEDQQKLEELINAAANVSAFVSNQATANFGLSLYRVDANNSVEWTTKQLNSIFQKRVFVINDYIDPANVERRTEQRLLFLNFCARTNTTFVDVSQIVQTALSQDSASFHGQVVSEYAMRWTTMQGTFPSNYSPKLIIAAISTHLKALKVKGRDVLLYGYPAGDTPAERSSNERYFPRASDEIQGIEKDIGSVRIVAVMTEAKVEWQITDTASSLEPPAEKPKKVAGEDGAEDDAPPAEEEEEVVQQAKEHAEETLLALEQGLPERIREVLRLPSPHRRGEPGEQERRRTQKDQPLRADALRRSPRTRGRRTRSRMSTLQTLRSRTSKTHRSGRGLRSTGRRWSQRRTRR